MSARAASVRCLIAFATGTLLFASAARAATDVTIIGLDLTPRRVTLQSLRSEAISFFDENRQYQSASLRKLLQLRSDQTVDESAAGAMLELTDGQRIRGTSLGAADNGQSLRWKHPALGEMTISLDRLRSMRRTDAAPLPVNVDEDRVTFTNGDQMSGFIASLTDLGVRLRLPDQDLPIDLPLDRVALIEFANPRSSPEAGMHMIHFTDGSRVNYDAVVVDGAVLVLGSKDAVRVDLASLVRVDFAGGEGHLADLATMPWEQTGGGEVFGMPTPPRVERGILRLHAPVTVRFNLPEGSTRAAMLVELDLEPRDGARWADVSVLVSSGAGNPSRVQLNVNHSSGRVNIPVAGNTLTIQLETAANGPVMDRVRLRDAVILVRPPDRN